MRHRLKPEWDEVPLIVKEDAFLGTATIDDLIALKMVWKRPVNEMLSKTNRLVHLLRAAIYLAALFLVFYANEFIPFKTCHPVSKKQHS